MKGMVRTQILDALTEWLSVEDEAGVTNQEKLVAFADKNGGVRIIINSLEDAFNPTLKKPLAPGADFAATATAQAAANENQTKKPAAAPTAPPKRGNGGPAV
jgi:hypothetical protein